MAGRKFLNNPYFFLLLAVILFFPAFLINLGDQPIIEDEAIRSLVAFEMHKSGDYVTPTIGGDPYLRKPPLYNWLIAASFSIFGSYSEVAIRVPTIISLFLYGMTIFLFVRRELGTKLGVINALIFITLGRVIFFESLHGLIDLSFSWLTYLFFMSSYILFNKKKFLLLFIVAYLITSVTWMMKGLPSVVFTGISLLVLFISQKRFKLLLNWRHFAGILLFLILVGSYYVIYFRMNDIRPEELFFRLIEQTTRRTVIRFGWLITIGHLFSFPFEMFYHFLPWTIFSAVFFIKGSFRKIKSHPFIKYHMLLLIFNIILYWTSPEVHPRYILMLVPLYFTAVTWLYFNHKEKGSRIIRIVEYIVFGFLLLACVAPFAGIWHEMTRGIDHILLISILLSAAMLVITFYYWKHARMRVFWFAIALLVFRIGFDFVILPTRQMDSLEVKGKESAMELARRTSGIPLYSYWNPNFEPTIYYGRNFIQYRYHYHLSVARDEIIYNTSRKIPGALCFSDKSHIEGQPHVVVGEVVQELDATRPYVLFKFVPVDEE